MTLKELIMNNKEYEILPETVLSGGTSYYIVPVMYPITHGYEKYRLMVAPKQLSKIQEEIAGYESLRDSPVWKMLEGEDE